MNEHGGVAQTLAVPAPPQVCVPLQVPHEATVRLVPQLSPAVTAPQVLPRRAQKTASVSPVQPHTLGTPAPAQLSGEAQGPHEATLRGPPQLSVPLTGPQFLPRRPQKPALVSGVQPHTLGVSPPEQVWGAVQVP